MRTCIVHKSSMCMPRNVYSVHNIHVHVHCTVNVQYVCMQKHCMSDEQTPA